MTGVRGTLTVIAGLVGLAVGAQAAYTATAEEAALIETIIRGLEDRDAALDEFQATVICRSWMTDSHIQSRKKWLERDAPMQNLGLYLLDIRYGGEQWWIDSATVVADGVEGSPAPSIAREPAGRKSDPDFPGRGALVTRMRCDGEKIARWNLEHAMGETQRTRAPEQSRSMINHPLTEMLVWFDGPAGGFFRKYPPYSVAGPIEVDGRVCYRISSGSDRPEGYGPYRLHMWVAPALGFSIVRTSEFFAARETPDSGSRTERHASDFREVSPGVWFPTEVISTRYSYRTEFQPPWRSTRVYTVVDVQVGPGTAPGFEPFDVRLPPGVMVEEYDEEGKGVGKYVTGFQSPEAQALVRDFDDWLPPPPDEALNRQPTKAEIDALIADAARGEAARKARGAGGDSR